MTDPRPTPPPDPWAGLRRKLNSRAPRNLTADEVYAVAALLARVDALEEALREARGVALQIANRAAEHRPYAEIDAGREDAANAILLVLSARAALARPDAEAGT